MKYKQLLASVFCLFVLAGSVSCSSDKAEQTQQSTEEDAPVATETPEPSPPLQQTPTETLVIEDEPTEEDEEKSEPEPDGPKYENGDSDYLFDQNRLHTFELTLSEENLAFLDAEPGREEYVEYCIRICKRKAPC